MSSNPWCHSSCGCSMSRLQNAAALLQVYLGMMYHCNGKCVILYMAWLDLSNGISITVSTTAQSTKITSLITCIVTKHYILYNFTLFIACLEMSLEKWVYVAFFVMHKHKCITKEREKCLFVWHDAKLWYWGFVWHLLGITELQHGK